MRDMGEALRNAVKSEKQYASIEVYRGKLKMYN